MKGSPFQRNFGIGGPAKLKKDDSAMKMKKDSAMDMKEPMKMKKDSPMDMKTSMKMKEAAMKMGHKSPSKMGHKSPSKMGHKSPAKAAKPDFPDIDGDGNTTESMKQAAADKKSPAKQMKPGDLTESELRERKDKAMKDRMKKENEPFTGERSKGGLKTDSTKRSPAKQKKQIKAYDKEVQELKEMIAKLSEPRTMAADSTAGSFTPKNLKKVQKKQKKVQKSRSKAIKKGAVEKKD